MILPRHLFLTWHGIGRPQGAIDEAARQFWLPTDVLERTLEAAGDVERRTGIRIGFTFDDGNASDHAIVLPRLVACRRTATFFVCAGRIGQPGYLTAAELRDMHGAGMAIGCHGYAHRNWREASDGELAHELKEGRRAIEDVVGASVISASVPFGALDKRVARAAAANGFKSLFTSSGGIATAETGLVPRNTIKVGFSPEQDLARMATRTQRLWSGAYDKARRLKYGFY
jgi:peptidoglycan/xylan/chitin deacetylase (PgdA/CDA1 family)